MSAPTHLPDAEREVWEQMTAAGAAPGPELEAFAGQVARLREAQRRIAAEGLIIADAKGNPIPHPAISIEKAAQAEIRAWGGKLTKPRRSPSTDWPT